jgi:hypothetical protein
MTARRAIAEVQPGGEPRIAEALAGLVSAIGGADFPVRFLGAMRAIAGVELCSVFQRNRGEAVSLVFAEGEADAPDFSVRASLDYARSYWRSDHQITRLSQSARKGPVVVRKRAEEIADPAWRAACYERAQVSERLTIFSPGPPVLIANGYRTASCAPFSAQDVARLEQWAPLLIATLERHRHADTATANPLQ